MKNGFRGGLAVVALLVAVSCSKDDPAPATPTGPEFPTSPEAKAEHDTKSGGVYKGTFATATTSGSIKVILQEGKTEMIINYNGTTRTLTTTDLASWTSGDTIPPTNFTSTDWTAVFAASEDGTVFSFGLDLAGANTFQGLIVKEVSTAQVKIYEGTYAGDATGKWNFATQGNGLAGVYVGSGFGYFEGTINGTAITITETGGSVTASGTFTNSGKDCAGAWASTSTDGSWVGAQKF